MSHLDMTAGPQLELEITYRESTGDRKLREALSSLPRESNIFPLKANTQRASPRRTCDDRLHLVSMVSTPTPT